MKTRYRVILALIVVAVICALVHYGSQWAERGAQRAEALDIQYREMTYAMVQGQAGERVPDHPMARLYRERRDALVTAGYLKKREFPLQHRFTSSRNSSAFLHGFITNFPGVEVRLRASRDKPPVIEVYARDRDLLAIKWFIVKNDRGD